MLLSERFHPKNLKAIDLVHCVGLNCPNCEDEFANNGPVSISAYPSEDKRYSEVAITFRGECGHEMILAFKRYKGLTEVFWIVV
jgi:hypothetical protein